MWSLSQLLLMSRCPGGDLVYPIPPPPQDCGAESGSPEAVFLLPAARGQQPAEAVHRGASGRAASPGCLHSWTQPGPPFLPLRGHLLPLCVGGAPRMARSLSAQGLSSEWYTA